MIVGKTLCTFVLGFIKDHPDSIHNYLSARNDKQRKKMTVLI